MKLGLHPRFTVQGATSAFQRPAQEASKLECLFDNRGWKNIWSLPHYLKFQPIELVWGGGKQPAAQLYRADLIIGFYGCAGHGSIEDEPLAVTAFWAHAKGEINAWISEDKRFEEDGLSGDVSNFFGMGQWTATAADCLDIRDMEDIATVKAGGLELEDAGSVFDSDSDSADGAE
jgi:hypothetical protein